MHLLYEFSYYNFEQFIFYQKWKLLKQKANQKNIKIFGDIPIYVSLDSADVWANQEIFHLDNEGKPTHISGVPLIIFQKQVNVGITNPFSSTKNTRLVDQTT